MKHFLVVFWRRSLGFIAASRVSYGPLPEYKATQGKNYNKINKKSDITNFNFNSCFLRIWKFKLVSICCKFATFVNIWCNLKFSRWCGASLCSNFKLGNCCQLSAAGTNPPNINKYLFSIFLILLQSA